MHKFKAFRIQEIDGNIRGGFTELALDELDAGEVIIKVAYSSVNYKDALAATGAGRIIRRFPCIGGIDLSGTVVESADPAFSAGDEVIATSYDIGVAHDGGYAEYARIPSAWVVPLPAGLTLFDAMALGTAGFTAALAVVRMEENGLQPANGPVLVNGATGGVGSVAIDILAKLGYSVTALTGKENETAYLQSLGAKDVMLRQSLDFSKTRPLDKATWAGAVDALGGDMLAWIASTMLTGGAIASVGLAAGHTLNTTVMPFILRGVSLLGIDSVNCQMARRERIWQRLGSDMRPLHLAAMTKKVAFSELPDVFNAFIQGTVKGRIVIAI